MELGAEEEDRKMVKRGLYEEISNALSLYRQQ